MKEKTREKIINTFRIIILSFILSTAIGYSLADWSAPSGAPPLNNVPPPINVGAATQEKAGNLFLTGSGTLGGTLGAKNGIFTNNVTVLGKITSASTVDGDLGNVVVTKDYLLDKASAVLSQSKSYTDSKITTSPGLYQCPVVPYVNLFGSPPVMDNGYLDIIVVSLGPLVTTTSGCHGGSVPTASPKPTCAGQTTVDSVCSTRVTTGSFAGGYTETYCHVACTPL